MDQVVVPLTDPQDLTIHHKDIKSQWVILDSVKDHIIPHLSEKKMTKDMLDALLGLFQSTKMNRKMVLRNKLRYMQMSIFGNFTNYFMMITLVCDELAFIGEKLDDIELVNVALNGFTKSWEPFFKGFCTREKLPDWQRLWDDCI
jgi:hypothetical protein